jgi:hypothetical protein
VGMQWRGQLDDLDEIEIESQLETSRVELGS